MPRRSAALACARCGWWSGYDATKRGVKHIDTVCVVCQARLRHTPRSYDWTWQLKTVPPAYARGSGAHNRSKSVTAVRPAKPGQGKNLASELNRDKMLQQAGLANVNPSRDGWPVDLFD